MNKPEFISKYEHQLTLKNYSENTLKAYLNGLHIFLDYLSSNQISEVSSKELDLFFHHCKKRLGCSYSVMKQLLVSVKFLYEEVLNGMLILFSTSK
jgi:site-specific recombinase XerD